MPDKEDESLGILGNIKESINEMKELMDVNRIERSDFEPEDIDRIVRNAKGNSVTRKRVARIASHLDRDEQPHYLNKGGSYFGLRIEGGGSEIHKRAKGKGFTDTMNNLKGNVLIATDKRVLIVAMQTTGDDVHSIPYDTIAGVDSAKGFPQKITIQTHGRTYHMEAGNEKDSHNELITYIREMRTKANEGSMDLSQEETPLEKIEKLGELKENGVISDSEFESKKAELMDKL